MLPANWQVLLNNVDISKQVADISNISAELDLEDPIVFNTSEARMTVNYPLPSDLVFRADVSIVVDSILKYKGNILSIDKDLKGRIADVVVSDITQSMRNKPLDNFGLSKRVRLSKVGDTESGEYPFGDALSPVSNNSLDEATAVVGRESYDSGVLEFAESYGEETPIDFGFIDDAKIQRISWEDGYIYKTTETLDLRIRINCDLNKTYNVACRFSFSPPRKPTFLNNTTNLRTLGSQIFNQSPVNDSISADGGDIRNLPAGAYFYFFLNPTNDTDIEVSISNRRIRLSFGTGAIKYLMVVDSFVVEGDFDSLHVSYDEKTLRSEGEALEYNPDVTIKSPYRNKSPVFVVNKILEYYGITNSQIDIDLFTLEEPYFSSNGRVGYEIESELDVLEPLAEGVETNIFWTGRITDYLVDDNKFYFLYSSRIDSPKARSKIIEYNPDNDSYNVFFEKGSHAEWWKLEKVSGQNIFYVLGTTLSSIIVSLPTVGAYDPTEANPRTLIEKIESGVSSTYISSGYTFRPVVGMYYQLGFPIDGANDNVRRGILPDTRKGFVLDNNNLYYLFANSLSYGVAKASSKDMSTAFITLPLDDYFNHLGADFAIAKSVMYVGAVFQKESTATREVYKKRLG